MSKMIKRIKKEVKEERQREEKEEHKVVKFEEEVDRSNASSKFGSRGYAKRSQGVVVSGARK